MKLGNALKKGMGVFLLTLLLSPVLGMENPREDSAYKDDPQKMIEAKADLVEKFKLELEAAKSKLIEENRVILAEAIVSLREDNAAALTTKIEEFLEHSAGLIKGITPSFINYQRATKYFLWTTGVSGVYFCRSFYNNYQGLGSILNTLLTTSHENILLLSSILVIATYIYNANTATGGIGSKVAD